MKPENKINFTAEERRHMIVNVFAVAIQNRENRWHTTAEIARKIGMKECPYLRGIMLGMVQNDQLVRREVERCGRWPGYEYMLPEGQYSEPKARTIPLKAKGVVVEQMELF